MYSYSHLAISTLLFEVFTLNKNANPDKYKYSGYGTEFDSHIKYIWQWVWKNVILFGADMSSYVILIIQKIF